MEGRGPRGEIVSPARAGSLRVRKPSADRHSTARIQTVVADDSASPDRRLGRRGLDVLAFNHGTLDEID